MPKNAWYRSRNGVKAYRHWFVPYFYSLVYRDKFRPVLCCLHTDWKCKIDCHHCWQCNNNLPGMTLETAKSSIDWLKSVGCRVVALMGGEPLLRPDFILDVIRYGHRQSVFMYLPTNGHLMDEKFIDEAGRAGVTAVKLAVDASRPGRGCRKRYRRSSPSSAASWSSGRDGRYMVFFNINICRMNIRDIKLLTEITRQNGIGTDYHLNETPQEVAGIDHFAHPEINLGITPDRYVEVDALLDWLIACQREGRCMVKSISHLEAMKARMRGRISPWEYRAGHKGALIRHDATLSPCFDMITREHDWGRVWQPSFDPDELCRVRTSCRSKCSSTCDHTMASYYSLRTISEWIGKHAQMG